MCVFRARDITSLSSVTLRQRVTKSERRLSVLQKHQRTRDDITGCEETWLAHTSITAKTRRVKILFSDFKAHGTGVRDFAGSVFFATLLLSTILGAPKIWSTIGPSARRRGPLLSTNLNLKGPSTKKTCETTCVFSLGCLHLHNAPGADAFAKFCGELYNSEAAQKSAETKHRKGEHGKNTRSHRGRSGQSSRNAEEAHAPDTRRVKAEMPNTSNMIISSEASAPKEWKRTMIRELYDPKTLQVFFQYWQTTDSSTSLTNSFRQIKQAFAEKIKRLIISSLSDIDHGERNSADSGYG